MFRETGNLCLCCEATAVSASIREFVLWHRGQRKRQRMQVFPQSRVWGSGNRDLPVCKTIRPAVSFWATRRALENVPNQSGAPSALLVNERTQERSQQWALNCLTCFLQQLRDLCELRLSWYQEVTVGTDVAVKATGRAPSPGESWKRLKLVRGLESVLLGKGKSSRMCVPGPVPHLCSMMEEQAVRLRLVVFTPLQDSCRVNPKQMRQEQMVRLNFSRKQSRK